MAGAPARWGFHELSDRYARKLVDSAGTTSGDLVLDLGAGRGNITRHLLDRGTRVVALELHPGRAASLRSRFDSDRLRVVEADVCTWRLPSRPFRVVANPPFALTAEILRRLTAPHSAMVTADLVVPSYVAARWARGAGHSTRYLATVVCRLPPSAFHPPATQPTAVLRLRARRRTRR